MSKLTRRVWMRQTAAGCLGCVGFAARDVLGAPEKAEGCTLSIGTYATQGMPLEKAIRLVAETGYDGLEISVQPDYGATPAELPADRRKELRRLIDDSGLALTSLMEHLPPAVKDDEHSRQLDRLRRVTELAHDLAPSRPPLIQTVLGGGAWDEAKDLFRDRLRDWLTVAEEAEIVLAVKPHRGGAMSRPSEAVWLIEQFGSPRLRMVYDYSHYALRDMPLEETVKTALPIMAHVAVKDAVQQGDRVVFQLPGESGAFDYPELLQLLYDGGYRGDVCCEVSSMVSKAAGYDPGAALQTCYRNMARAFQEAKVPRRRREAR